MSSGLTQLNSIDQSVAGSSNGVTLVTTNTGSSIAAEMTATKRLRVQQDGTTIFYEAWDAGTVETVFNWNPAVVGGTGLSTPSAGQLIISSGTTANSFAYLTSKTKFQPVPPGFLEIDQQQQVTFPIPAHAYAYWGVGTVPGSPTAVAPLTDAIGFEVTATGLFNAVTFAGGARTVIAALTPIADSNVHRYFIFIRGDTIYWTVDGTTVASILTGALGPNTNLLPLMILSGTDAVGAASALQSTNAAVYIGDSTKSRVLIADAVHPQYAMSVKMPSSATAITDMPAVFAAHPSTPIAAVTYSPVQTPVIASATGAAAAIAPSMAAVAAKTNYCSGFEVTSDGSTVGAAILVTITGILGGTLNYSFPIPTGVLVGAAPLVVPFNPPLPASAVNVAITLNMPSAGAGNTTQSATIHGFNQ